MKLNRILYGSDFHGSEMVYRKFLASALQYQANAAIVGGDVTGKAMVPILHEGNQRYSGHLYGRKEVMDSLADLESFQKKVSGVGFYPIVVEREEAEFLEKNPEVLGKRFELEMGKRVREWMVLAEEKLAPKGIDLYFMPGNDDLFEIDAIIDEFPHVHNPDLRKIRISDDHDLVGCSYANMTPWHCARDLEEPELLKKLEQMFSLVDRPDYTIAAIHVPPMGSGLDTCPELDKDLKIVSQGGQVLMKSAGSSSVMELIKKYQPLLTLHGHIHESPGHVRIGKTLAINAGSEYAEGILKAAIINLEGNRVKGHLLISG